MKLKSICFFDVVEMLVTRQDIDILAEKVAERNGFPLADPESKIKDNGEDYILCDKHCQKNIRNDM